MDMRSIYIANGVGIFILLMLQYTSRTKIQRSRPEDRIYSFMVIGVMLDVDGFKRINDAYGHSEGDRALKTVTDLLKRSRLDHEWVFRFAGDEFIVLKRTRSADGLKPYMDEVLRRLEEYNGSKPLYPLSLSYGMSFFETGDMDTFMKEMDDNMYRMKAGHHAREANPE